MTIIQATVMGEAVKEDAAIVNLLLMIFSKINFKDKKEKIKILKTDIFYISYTMVYLLMLNIYEL